MLPLDALERRIYLACIAGSAMSIKWRVEEYAVEPSFITGFCQANLGTQAEYLRATPGLSSQAIALCRSIALCGSEQGSPSGLLSRKDISNNPYAWASDNVTSLCELGPGLWDGSEEEGRRRGA